VTLKKEWTCREGVPLPKKPEKLSVVLSHKQVAHLLAQRSPTLRIQKRANAIVSSVRNTAVSPTPEAYHYTLGKASVPVEHQARVARSKIADHYDIGRLHFGYNAKVQKSPTMWGRAA
jgi:hypothetical protein